MPSKNNSRGGFSAPRGSPKEMIRCKVDKKLEPLDQFSNNQLKNYQFHKTRGKTIELRCRKHTQESTTEILCEECGKLGPPELFSNVGRKNAENSHRCRDCISWAETDMPGTAALPAPRAPRAANEYEFIRPEPILDDCFDEDDDESFANEDHLDKNLHSVITGSGSTSTSNVYATETVTSAAMDGMGSLTLDGGDDDDDDDVSAASSGDSTQAVTNAPRRMRTSHKNPSDPCVKTVRNTQQKGPINNVKTRYTAYGPNGQVQQRTKAVPSASAATSVKASSVKTVTTVREVSSRGGFAKVKGRRMIPEPPNYLVWDHPDDRKAAHKRFSDGESEDEI